MISIGRSLARALIAIGVSGCAFFAELASAEPPSARVSRYGGVSFALGGVAFDVTAGRVGVGEKVTVGARSGAHDGEMRFGGVSAHMHLFGAWSAGAEAELGSAELARRGWRDVSEEFSSSAFSLTAGRPLAAPWLASLLGPGEFGLTLSVSQPLRLEQEGRSVYAPGGLDGDLALLDPRSRGRERRVGARFDYFAANQVSAFGEATYAVEPGHIANADPEARVRLGLSARF